MILNPERTDIGIVLFFVLLTMFSRSWAMDLRPSVDPVAIVNGSRITFDAYGREMAVVMKRAAVQRKEIGPAALFAIRKIVLDNMIGRELLYQESQKAGIVVTFEEVNARLMSLKNEPAKEIDFERALVETNLDEDTLRQQIKRQMSRQKYIDMRIAPGITVTENELQRFYDENSRYFSGPDSLKAYDDVKDTIARYVKRHKIDREVKRLIEQLRVNGDVKQF